MLCVVVARACEDIRLVSISEEHIAELRKARSTREFAPSPPAPLADRLSEISTKQCTSPQALVQTPAAARLQSLRERVRARESTSVV